MASLLVPCLLLSAFVAARPVPAPQRHHGKRSVTEKQDLKKSADALCDSAAFLDTTGSSLAARPVSKRVFYVDGAEATVWDLGAFSAYEAGVDGEPPFVRANTMYVPVRETGESAGKPVVGIIPCQRGYSDAWVLTEVIVPDNLKADSIRDLKSIENYEVNTKSIRIMNLPILPHGATIPGANVSLSSAWYKGKAVVYINLGDAEIRSAEEEEDDTLLYRVDMRRAVMDQGAKLLEGFEMGGGSFFGPVAIDSSFKNTWQELRSFSQVADHVTPLRNRGLAMNMPVVSVRRVRYVDEDEIVINGKKGKRSLSGKGRHGVFHPVPAKDATK
ncbi:hypothetical protein HK101_005405 [Irineochytrium annulatum]|nr:hypothetical protein HK101_005405 [Irineochytrium annulatum]